MKTQKKLSIIKEGGHESIEIFFNAVTYWLLCHHVLNLHKNALT